MGEIFVSWKKKQKNKKALASMLEARDLTPVPHKTKVQNRKRWQ